MKHYRVFWKRPQIYEEERRGEWEGGFSTREEAEKYADAICREYDDNSVYHKQVHDSIQIEDYEV